MAASVETSDDLIGVTAATAGRVVGVSTVRLAAWETHGLVKADVRRQVSGRLVRIYRLNDLVELCIVKGLEDKGQKIRTIRRVVDAIRSSTITHPLRELRWGVDPAVGEIYVGYDDGSWVGGRRPAQTVIVEVINVEEIRAEARRKAQERPASTVGKIEQRDRTMGRKPVFAGTRTPVDAVLAYMKRGSPDSEILEAFPHLEQDDLAVARTRIA
jgi:uncharacterized protein (DUF433 family)